MNHELSIIPLLLNASWVVKAVVLILIGMSLASWTTIFSKLLRIKRVKSQNDAFDKEFWSGTSLNDLYAAALRNAKETGPMERIFRDQHAAGSHISFSIDAQTSAWGLAAAGGEITNPVL
jgi:biopolymer transport protein TolQ